MRLNINSMLCGLLISISMLNGCTTPQPLLKTHLQDGEKYNYFKNSSDNSTYSNESKANTLDIYRENRGKPESNYPEWYPKDRHS